MTSTKSTLSLAIEDRPGCVSAMADLFPFENENLLHRQCPYHLEDVSKPRGLRFQLFP